MNIFYGMCLTLLIKHYSLVKKMLLGNKCDLIKQKVVDVSTAQKYANHLEIPFLEVSAKNGTNLKQAFRQGLLYYRFLEEKIWESR